MTEVQHKVALQTKELLELGNLESQDTKNHVTDEDLLTLKIPASTQPSSTFQLLRSPSPAIQRDWDAQAVAMTQYCHPEPSAQTHREGHGDRNSSLPFQSLILRGQDGEQEVTEEFHLCLSLCRGGN